MSKRRNYRELADVELSPELESRVRAMTKEADEEIEAARVNFRWGREQVELVKRVAELMGVPYQTYIKQVVYKQAIADLNEASAAVSSR
jgi:predicted DNA binding CopG/RHH family protein